jgi:predicted short-subunit dehydrogenase-like oxidoreductase (DUF2520 family)
MHSSIVVLGTGNVAWHLCDRLSKSGHEIMQLYGRNGECFVDFKSFNINDFCTQPSQITPKADIYMICVSDDSILDAAGEWAFKLNSTQILVHTSGSVSSRILSPFSTNFASFWPIQTLRKNHPILTNKIPFVLSASNDFTLNALTNLAECLTNQCQVMDDDKKALLHTAAVIVNNFSNHLFSLTADYCIEEHIDFNLLTSLIQETALKTTLTHPDNLQTGPARRHDIKTIDHHMHNLHNYKSLSAIYSFFTKSIMEKYSKS